MSRTKRFMYNSISTAFYQIVVMLVGFVTPQVILRFYGSELNGLVSSITQFITNLSVVEAGIAGAAVYALYKPLADEDHEGISAIVSATKRFYISAGWIFTALISVMALIYPLFVKTSELSPLSVIILVFALGTKSFLEFFTLAKYRVILTADQKTYIVSIASSIYVVLQMIIIIVMSVLRVNIVVVYVVAIAAFFTRSFILRAYVRRNYSYIDYGAEPNTAALDKRWDALFLQLLGAAQTGAPVIIATIFTALEDVSVYTVYNMVFVGINGVLNIFVNGLSAGFGDVIVRKEQGTLKKSYKDFEYSYYILITVVYAVAMIMLMPFIDVYTAGIIDADYHRPLVAALFTINGLLFNIKTPQGMLIISAGMYKETRYRSLTQALIIIVGGMVLAPFFGLIGILIASCLSNLYRVIDLLFFVPKYITELPVKFSLIGMLRVGILFTLMTLPFVFFPIEVNGIFDWIWKAVLVTLGVSAVTAAVNYVANAKQFRYVLGRLKYMFKK